MSTATHHRLGWWLALPAGVFAGACMTLQARINAALTGQTHDAVLTGVISFGGGLLVLLLGMLFSRTAQQRFAGAAQQVRARTFPWWLTLGGLAGALYVFSQGQSVSVLGLALFTVSYVAAQTFGSFLWDHFGVGPGGHHAFSASRVIGAALAVVAVAVSVLAAHGGIGTASWLIVLPLVAGFATSWQAAANGRVRVMSGSVLVTTFWNFLVGTVALGLLWLAQHLWLAWPGQWSAEWWMLLGGPVGVVFIATGAIIVRTAGVLMLSLLLTLGQLAAALALSQYLPGTPQPELGTYLGTALAVAAVGVMLLPSNAKSRRSAQSASHS